MSAQAGAQRGKGAGAWLKRILAFGGEMFPVFPVQVAVFGGFALNYVALAHWFYRRPVRWDELILGGLTIVTLSFLLRVYDELKDYESDKQNFPDRPLVRGVATPRDMRLLIPVLHVLLLLFNLPFAGRLSFLVFLALVAFGYLMFKWFFMERVIRPSLPLAFVTHHPVVAIMQFYCLGFFRDAGTGFPLGAVLFVTCTALYATVWEIGRKIRGTSEETSYTTYSKIWGPHKPVILLLFLVYISIGCGLVATFGAVSPRWIEAFWVLPVGVFFRMLYKSIVFFRDPSRAPAPGFKALAESYPLALLGALLIMLGLDSWL